MPATGKPIETVLSDQMSDATRSGDRPLSPFSLSNLSLKDEDRACTAVADVCGEEVELLLVADGHGGPEVSQHG